jgi:phenylacetate-CoA ligase
MELSVIVPCLNEEENISELVRRLARVFDDERLCERGGAEVVIVDDGSNDATWSEMVRMRSAHAFVVPVRHARNLGLAAAWRTGMDHARGRLICILDADLQYRPEDILTLYESLETSRADLAQGYRSPSGRVRDARYFVSRGLHHLLNGLFSMELEDNKSGFVLCPREVFADLLDYRSKYTYWQLFIGVASHAKGYTICQVETAFEPRRRGRSFLRDLPLMPMLRASADVARAIREYGSPPRPKR